jgi:hypothetical protein
MKSPQEAAAALGPLSDDQCHQVAVLLSFSEERSSSDPGEGD